MKPVTHFTLLASALITMATMAGCGNGSTPSHDAAISHAQQVASLTNTPAKKAELSLQNDGPQSNTQQDSGEDKVSTAMPYYCDPNYYPRNIINSIRSCEPFLGIAGTYGTAPIGYRIRGDLLYGNAGWRGPWWGRRGGDYNHGHSSWRNRNDRYHGNNGAKNYRGTKRFGRP